MCFSAEGRARNDLCKIADLTVGIDRRKKLFFFYRIDLVDDENHWNSNLLQLLGNVALSRTYECGRLHQPHNGIYFLQGSLRNLYHVFSKLVFALWIPGVSKNTICPSSQVYTVCILFLVVCGLFDVMAIFCPIRWFISVDFPTFGLPMIATKPDLKLLSILYPLIILSQPAIPFNGQQALFLISRSVASLP